MVGGVNMADIPDLCRINLICYVPGFLLPENKTNMSYIDVHDILVYGFELSWFSFCCYYSTENRCNLHEATVKNNNCFNDYTEPCCTYSLSLSLSAYLKYCIMIMHTIFALFYIVMLQYCLVSVYVLRVYFIF